MLHIAKLMFNQSVMVSLILIIL